MANNTYSNYKRSKKLKSGLFWAIIFGVLLAIIIPIILITTSLSQINKQKTELENELRQDFNDISLIPHQSTSVEYVDTNDFIEQTSIDLDNANPFSTSQDLKEDYLKINPALSLPFFSSIILALNDYLDSLSKDKNLDHREFNDIGVINLNDETDKTDLKTDINFKGDGGTLSDDSNGLIAIEVSDGLMFPIFEKNTYSFLPSKISLFAAIDITSIRIVNSITDDGEYWWNHTDSYSIGGNEYINTTDISPNIWYFNVSIKVKVPTTVISIDINIDFEIENPSINFLYQNHLFSHSNHFISNLLIAAGVIKQFDENGNPVEEPIYNLDYSNVFYTTRQWLEYVADKYNTSELNGFYSFIYNETNWQDAWNELFNDEVLSSSPEDLMGILPFIDYTTLMNSPSEYQLIFKDKIQNPDFETFYEIMMSLNLIFDSRFKDSREAIINSMVEVVNLQDLPYPY